MSLPGAMVTLWGAEVGAVTWDEDRQLAQFEYTPEFITRGVELAPLHMPCRPGIWEFPALNRDTFSGLPGLLADSLPDKFGNALIDAWLARQGRRADSFSPIERLCYTGRRGMGALEYNPAKGPATDRDEEIQIAEMVRLSNDVLNARTEGRGALDNQASAESMRHILQVGTSAGGARAKAVIAWNETTGEVRSGQTRAPKGFGYWILKLDGIDHNRDKEASDDPQGHGIREYLFYLMAIEAGIEMSECRLFEENGRHHFMTRRFDRKPSGEKLMMQSLCAIDHADYNRVGEYSYEQLFAVMRDLGLGMDTAKEQFRRMAFCVLGRNCDDHTKNTAFLMDKDARWKLSPAFDLTFSYNPNGKWTQGHQMTINGKRQHITRHDLLTVGKVAGLSTAFMAQAIEQVQDALTQWDALVKEQPLPEWLSEETRRELQRARESFEQ